MSVVPKEVSKRKWRNVAPSAAGWTTQRLELAFGAGELGAVRTAVAAHATALGVEPERLEDTVLVVHELCGNAVMHGGGAGRLLLRRVGDELVCQVSDTGPGMGGTDEAGTELPSQRSPGGRGLWLARRFAAVRITAGPAGTTVVASLPLR